MKLKRVHRSKIDPELGTALERARGDESVRALMLLGGSAEENQSHAGRRARSTPSNREDLRRELIETRRSRLEGELGPMLDQLRDLSLSPLGGDILHTVVVEGPARSILKALEISGVRHASLDRKVRMVRPRSSVNVK